MRFRSVLAIVGLVGMCVAAAPVEMPVWPGLDEGLKNVGKVDERGKGEEHNRFVRDVAYPTMTVYLPEGATAATPAIVICPGGAYAGVAMDKEGFSVAKWLNTQGVAGVALKYRMPKPEVTKEGTPLPVLDAREALRIVRAHAKEWNIDPAKVGVMGFSAGGHLVSTVITQPAEDEAGRPNFAVLGYPVIELHDPVAHKGSRNRLLGEKPTAEELDKYSANLHVTDQTVPTFLVHAKDDHVLPKNSELFYAALQAHHVPSELHLLESGGHGFGLGTPGTPTGEWPGMLVRWLKSRGILAGEKTGG